MKDKHVLVTGAGGGMGKEIVKSLLQQEVNVVGCDMNVSTLEEFQNESNFLGLEGSLLDEEHIGNVFKKAYEEYGEIDGLVNAAGIAQNTTPIEEIDSGYFDKVMNINMKMVFLTCREAAKYMKSNQSGSIVNIGSVSTTRPRPGMQVYISSKGAVESFSKALALELAPFKIRVNVLHPGPSDTNMLGQFAQDGADIEDMKENVFRQSVPLGELIQPSDIAASTNFLLSNDAKMVTGAVLHVDGGRNV